MSFAGKAAQGATVHLPLGQLALVGLGFFCVTNPDRFFLTLMKGTQFFNGLPMLAPASSNQQQQMQQPQPAPIIIHHTAPGMGGGRTKFSFLIQLCVGAGFCWGSYVVLISVLPEGAKGLLPVNKSHFNKAVTSLGKAVINLKDSLMEQIMLLSSKQDDLGDQQVKTHVEVVDIRDNVHGMKGDVTSMKNALELCQASLTESERRTCYIARGVQLLTRGVSTILPEDEHLMNELVSFNMAGDEFNNKPTPLQSRMRQKRLSDLQQRSGNGATPMTAASHSSSMSDMDAIASGPSPQQLQFYSPTSSSAPLARRSSSSSSSSSSTSQPENELPTMSAVEESVSGVHALMSELGCKVISQ